MKRKYNTGGGGILYREIAAGEISAREIFRPFPKKSRGKVHPSEIVSALEGKGSWGCNPQNTHNTAQQPAIIFADVCIVKQSNFTACVWLVRRTQIKQDWVLHNASRFVCPHGEYSAPRLKKKCRGTYALGRRSNAPRPCECRSLPEGGKDTECGRPGDACSDRQEEGGCNVGGGGGYRRVSACVRACVRERASERVSE